MGRKILDTLLFLIVTAGCVLLTVALAGKDYRNAATIYNFVFLGIMVILYLVALFAGIFRMSDTTSYFQKAAGQIDEMPEDEALEKKIQALATFRPLRKCLGRFLQDLHRSQSGICDIEDYINEDETDSLVNKRLMDLVPTMLTSLGILGTFVGLVWGLRAFQPSTYETMTSSVSSLVDGIKVAFMTSIYGLILSLVCSFSITSGYQAMNDALHRFLDRFHTRLVPSAEMEAQNRMVNNQKEQSEQIRNLTAEFSDQVAHGFAASMAPTLDRINTQLGNMMTSISTNQQMFLQDIVDAFVKEMKSTFQTEYSQFGETLQTMNDMTNRNMMYSQQTCQKMTEELQSVFAQDERTMHDAVAQIAGMQQAMEESVRRMNEQTGQIIQNYAQIQDASLKNLAKSEKESARFWVACNQAMQNYLNEAANAYGHFEKANASSEEILAAITSVYKKNAQVLEDSEKRLKELQATQQMMNTSMEEIRRLFAQMEVAGSDGKRIILYPGMSRSSKEQEQRMLKQMENMILQSEERQGETLDAIRHSVKELNDRNAKKRSWFR